MSVAMKVSLRDLKQLLQDNTLLNENEAIPVVLPGISWTDRVQGVAVSLVVAFRKKSAGIFSKRRTSS